MDPYRRSVLAPIEQEDEETEDEQVKKTLRFFDSMLDEYLQDQEIEEKRSTLSHSANNLSQIKSKSREFIPAERKNSSAFQKYIPRQTSSQVRRYTSENNLNQLHLLPRSAPSEKSQRSSLLKSTATSTEDLTERYSKKNLSSSQNNLPTLNEQNALMGISASLIDLSPNQQNKTGPLFRFVPPKESPPDPIPKPKYPPTIVKPTVISPSITFPFPSAPGIRSSENHFHHENAVSPFKPLVSNKSSTGPSNETVEPRRISTAHVGLSNPNVSVARPVFHQSMFDLPASSTSDTSSSTKHHYIRQTNPNNRPTRYYPAPSASTLLTEPVNKFLQQMKDSSAINPYLSHRPNPYNGYPTAGSMMNDYDYSHRPSFYSRPSQPTPGNIYRFNAKPPLPPRSRTSKNTHFYGNEGIVTTFL